MISEANLAIVLRSLISEVRVLQGTVDDLLEILAPDLDSGQRATFQRAVNQQTERRRRLDRLSERIGQAIT